MCLSLEILTSIIGTSSPILVELIDLLKELIELCYNFSISNDLTQMVSFPTRMLDCDSHSPALLDLFVSVSIDFPVNSKRDAPFHRIASDYSCVLILNLK